MRSIRAQSVAEGLFKLLSLMFQRLSQGDNPYDPFAAFGENHNHYPVSEKTNSVPTVFSIILIKAVFADILFVLFLIPFKFHKQSLIARRLS